MEFLITSVWGGGFLLLFIFFTVMNRYKSKKSSLKLPPGPKPLPIIGNMHQLLGSNTHHILRDLSKRYGSLMHLQLGEVSILIVSSAEAAEQVMKTRDTIFSYRPRLLCFRKLNYDCTDIAFSPYGDYWRQLRKICMMELLSSKRVQSFRSIREEEVLNLVSGISLQKYESVNLSRKIFSFTSGLVSRTAFGKKGTYQEEFISVLEEAKLVTAGFNIADMYPSSGESKEDLVDVLLNIQESGDFGAPLTDNNIKAVILVKFYNFYFLFLLSSFQCILYFFLFHFVFPILGFLINFWCGKKDLSRRIICCSKYGTSTCSIALPFRLETPK